MNANPILVEALRGSALESAHRGAVAIVDADGHSVFALGDTARAVFPRSAVKLLQALPLVASGAAEALKLSDAELAIACASHNGEPAHVATARGMLEKAGLDADALECGTHWPGLDGATRELAARGEAAGPLHNNCSGKHAGFLCLACAMHGREGLRAFARGYVEPGHAVMGEVTAALQAATGVDLAQAPVGTDGCSIPTYAIPLAKLALAFARVATGQGLSPAHARAATRLRQAIARAPFMVAGTGRFDTRVMEALGERVCCKVGAEGVYCAALPDRGWGVAIKMDDGNNARAAEVVMAAVIEAALRLDAGPAALLRSLSDLTLRNWNGRVVGCLRATPALRDALAALGSPR